jgi:multiple sugar transport system permease protein
MVERKSAKSQLFIYVLLIFIVTLTLLPLVWMFSASLKLNKDVFTIPIQWIPRNPVWKNYVTIWKKIPFATFATNSFKLTIIVCIIQVFTSSFAAYGFAKCHFPGRNFLFLLYVATISIPWQVYMLPQFIEMRMLGLTNSHLGYILMQSFIAMGVFLIRQFYISIPDELLEAARIDGLNEYSIYSRIVLPLSKPALASLTIMSFVTIWNDFMGPMIYFTRKELKTIPLGIRMFIGQYSAEYSLIMAAAVLSIIPVFIVFMMFQKYFVQSVTSSGVKG